MNDDKLVIYAERAAVSCGPRRPARRDDTQPVATPMLIAPTCSGSSAEQLCRVIERPAMAGESINEAFVNKECELREVFRSLDDAAARSLLARLTDPKPGDRAMEAFARLGVDRRRRLLVFLEEVVLGRGRSSRRCAP